MKTTMKNLERIFEFITTLHKDNDGILFSNESDMEKSMMYTINHLKKTDEELQYQPMFTDKEFEDIKQSLI